HHMDDDVAAIDEHPFGAFLALDPDDRGAGGFHPFADVGAECLDLACRLRAGDDHRVAHRRELAHVEHQDVLALDLFERVYCHLLHFVQTHCLSTVKMIRLNVPDDGCGKQPGRAATFADHRPD